VVIGEMHFGATHLVGSEAITALFVKIDASPHIRHGVVVLGNRRCLPRPQTSHDGQEVRNPEPPSTLMLVYYLDEGQTPHVRTLRITVGPPQTDAAL
jgi:hypothetical protein